MKTNITERIGFEDNNGSLKQKDGGKIIDSSWKIRTKHESHSTLSRKENKSSLPKYELEMRIDGLFVTDPETDDCYKAIPLINQSSINEEDYVIKTSNGDVYFKILCQLSGKIKPIYI